MLNPDICKKCIISKRKIVSSRIYKQNRNMFVKDYTEEMFIEENMPKHIENFNEDLKMGNVSCILEEERQMSIFSDIPNKCKYATEHLVSMKQPTIESIIKSNRI